MSDVRDIWALVHDWRYTGKTANATEHDLWLDAAADILEKAIERSSIVQRSRYDAVCKEVADLEAKLAERSARALEVTAGLLSAVEKSKRALMSGQVGHISGDIAVYHLEGHLCGNALHACQEALGIAKDAQL